MDHRRAFGGALRAFRKERGLSQDELAFRAEMDRTYISLLELGRKSPTLDTLVELAKALGMRVSDLIAKMEERQCKKKP